MTLQKYNNKHGNNSLCSYKVSLYFVLKVAPFLNIRDVSIILFLDVFKINSTNYLLQILKLYIYV